MLALAEIMRRCAAAISGRRCNKVAGTPLGICGRLMSTISGLIENVEADTPSNAAIACSISARWASVCPAWERSEEHTSELQSHLNLVCRLLLEKKKTDMLRPDRTPLQTT